MLLSIAINCVIKLSEDDLNDYLFKKLYAFRQKMFSNKMFKWAIIPSDTTCCNKTCVSILNQTPIDCKKDTSTNIRFRMKVHLPHGFAIEIRRHSKPSQPFILLNKYIVPDCPRSKLLTFSIISSEDHTIHAGQYLCNIHIVPVQDVDMFLCNNCGKLQ